jgi:hypothetical protein
MGTLIISLLFTFRHSGKLAEVLSSMVLKHGAPKFALAQCFLSNLVGEQILIPGVRRGKTVPEKHSTRRAAVLETKVVDAMLSTGLISYRCTKYCNWKVFDKSVITVSYQ